MEQVRNKPGTCGRWPAEEKNKGYRLDDRRVQKILALIESQHHGNLIAEKTKIPKTTVHRVIKRLLRQGIIEEIGKNNSKPGTKGWCTTYRISNVGQYHIHNEGVEADSGFIRKQEKIKVAWHAVSVKFEILSRPKIEPQPTKYYRPNGWEGKIIEDDRERFKMRITPKSMIIDFSRQFCDTLPPNTEEELKRQYWELAASFVGKFAEKNGYEIGPPQYCRYPHVEVPVTNVIAELFPGEIYYPKRGIKKDCSGEEGRRGLEGVGKAGAEHIVLLSEGILKIPELVEMIRQLLKIVQNQENSLEILLFSTVEKIIPQLVQIIMESTLKTTSELVESKVHEIVTAQFERIIHGEDKDDKMFG